MTILGLIGNIAAAALIGFGYVTYGGLMALLAGACDGLDGSLARLRNEVSPWGAFVDSVTDRYSELFLLLGLLVYYQRQGDGQMMILVYVAAAGAVLVSYVKSRAETLGYTAKIGILSRMERYLVLDSLPESLISPGWRCGSLPYSQILLRYSAFTPFARRRIKS